MVNSTLLQDEINAAKQRAVHAEQQAEYSSVSGAVSGTAGARQSAQKVGVDAHGNTRWKVQQYVTAHQVTRAPLGSGSYWQTSYLTQVDGQMMNQSQYDAYMKRIGEQNTRELARISNNFDAWLTDLLTPGMDGAPALLSQQDYRSFRKMIDGATDAKSLAESFRLAQANLNWAGYGRTVEQDLGDAGAADSGWDIESLFGGGGYGGGGGGGLGPTYRKPDERVIEDMAKGMLNSLVGTVPDDLVKPLVAKYMTDHKRNWDSETETIEPEQSMLEMIRGTERYQQLHALRPESEDERSWVSQRRNAAAQGGLSTPRQEDFAIDQAMVGGDTKDIARAGAFEEVRASGSTQGTMLRNRMKDAATNVFKGAV